MIRSFLSFYTKGVVNDSVLCDFLFSFNYIWETFSITVH